MARDNKDHLDSDLQYFFDLNTGEVTRGKTHGWEKRMGPYGSAEEARNALKIAQQRTQTADSEDQAEDSWGKPASWE